MGQNPGSLLFTPKQLMNIHVYPFIHPNIGPINHAHMDDRPGLPRRQRRGTLRTPGLHAVAVLDWYNYPKLIGSEYHI